MKIKLKQISWGGVERNKAPPNMESRKQLAKRIVEVINNEIAQNDRPLQKKYYERYKACFICLHNEDKAGFEKWTTKLIATAHKLIDDLEADCNNLDLTIVNDKSEKTIHIKEDAYLKSCNVAKENIERVETLLATLALIKGDVKQVLQASKRMNKRRNRKD